jgi:drug/metabolite transporter (DMT)-like permease
VTLQIKVKILKANKMRDEYDFSKMGKGEVGKFYRPNMQLIPPDHPLKPESSSMNRLYLGLFLGFLGVVCFGGTLPMTRLAVFEVQPWFITFARGAGAALIGIIVLITLKKPMPPKSEWRDYCIASLGITIGFPGLVALGMREVPASHGGVILGIIPLATAGLSAIVTGERPTKLFWALSVLGAALVVIFALRQSGDFSFHKGDFILFGAVFAASTAYVFSGKLSKNRPGWEVVSWALLPMFPFMLIGFLYTFPANFLELKPSTYWGLAYVILISQYFGFFPWNAGLAMGGIARVGQMMLIMPFITLVFSSYFLGETITSEMIIFLTAVLVVVLTAARVKV